ncbi:MULTISPECIES: LysE family transporter [unclassified Amycolatopsis]|uniref:LysE/ArgO family amino acid transporter n=1 Tax=unclassified Amycolatopsis TaxID=2618356 RepID=UPI002876A559|nr:MULTISPECIES: LysE family transporter [unclassified Amycolatopsis]MDS0138959.1 LysE family transporter [Amycolatopsis sp. 505]MDS0147631.1 LysE family transporter [Amycolatopsis sp. CM201R]
MLPLLLAGFGTGLSLIVAIGSQNAFLLQQGLRGGAVAPLVVICAVSDLVLIGLGVSGVGAVLERWPTAIGVIAVGGGLFLLGYGVLAARRALRPSVMIVGEERTPLRKAVVACIAFTWLNPHVYLDTVLLLGSVAAAQGDGRWLFGVGAGVASAVWFSALGFGARRLAGVFAKPMAWRVLDVVIAVTMTGLGVGMLLTHV